MSLYPGTFYIGRVWPTAAAAISGRASSSPLFATTQTLSSPPESPRPYMTPHFLLLKAFLALTSCNVTPFNEIHKRSSSPKATYTCTFLAIMVQVPRRVAADELLSLMPRRVTLSPIIAVMSADSHCILIETQFWDNSETLSYAS